MVRSMWAKNLSGTILSTEEVLDALPFRQTILQKLSIALKMGRACLSITPQNTICRGPGF